MGYAIALCKKILIITPERETLPYMARKLDCIYDFIEILNANEIDINIKSKIKAFVSNE
ncbi:hypothetical protein EHE19_010905 [Ruminiclostridium herbifermentans]|uniref:Uncharacterized protein n=1 Tax=Ruminiclostridium herbifermentans TaxID=2488810 RepID=A0A7H1VJ79_9FIRM|nr:hypothetical protein [Ruminiclostridium herbifermentans]QNU65441.1 hypothetical protein EHE19_010905 [Ruminiclostridium herbifermentans]